jgi:hypothetical protein
MVAPFSKHAASNVASFDYGQDPGIWDFGSHRGRP